jgi:hypothetical protein
VLGTLGVIDDKPRTRDDFDVEALVEFAAMVEAEVASFSPAIGDDLTGLANRRGFEMLGERLVTAARLGGDELEKSLWDVVGEADASMFEAKRAKKAHRWA